MRQDFEENANEINTGLSFPNLLRPISDFEKKEAEWLVPGWMPKGQIITLASEGGIGKTSVWVALAAAISAGNRFFLDPEGYTRKHGKLNYPIDYSLLINQPVPQNNALYIINLVTIRTLLEGSWETELDKWQFLARYVTLYPYAFNEEVSEPDPLKTKSLDIFDELPLRFMAIFQVERGDNNTVVIKKRNRQIDLTDWSPLDARAALFSFLQDNVSEAIYSLHGTQITLRDKTDRLRQLLAIDVPMHAELHTAELQMTLYKKNRTVNEHTIKAFFMRFVELIRDDKLNSSDAISWLINFRYIFIDLQNGIHWETDDPMILGRIPSIVARRCLGKKKKEWDTVLFLFLETIKPIMPYVSEKEVRIKIVQVRWAIRAFLGKARRDGQLQEADQLLEILNTLE